MERKPCCSNLDNEIYLFIREYGISLFTKNDYPTLVKPDIFQRFKREHRSLVILNRMSESISHMTFHPISGINPRRLTRSLERLETSLLGFYWLEPCVLLLNK